MDICIDKWSIDLSIDEKIRKSTVDPKIFL